MKPSKAHTLPRLVVIGASAGGLEALKAILPLAALLTPVVVVLHLPAKGPSLLPNIFKGAREAHDKQKATPGLFFAPAGYHLFLEKELSFSLSLDSPEMYSRPSIDVLFWSAARACGPDVLGILLSGANSDGSKGLRAILDQGGRAWIQEPSSAVAQEMPRSAISLCPEAEVMPLASMRELLAMHSALKPASP